MGGPSQQKVDLKEVKEKQALARSQLLRQAFGFLPEGAFKQRQKYFAAKVNRTTSLSAAPSPYLSEQQSTVQSIHFLLCTSHSCICFCCILSTSPVRNMQDTGVFSQKSEQKSAQEQMMTNPDMMSGMMKQNLVGIIPQVSV